MKRPGHCPGIYEPQIKEGAEAPAGTDCPYTADEIGARCSWLAGHYDAHGYDAWVKARGAKPL